MNGELQSYSEDTIHCILAHFLQCSKNDINPVKGYLQALQEGVNK